MNHLIPMHWSVVSDSAAPGVVESTRRPLPPARASGMDPIMMWVTLMMERKIRSDIDDLYKSRRQGVVLVTAGPPRPIHPERGRDAFIALLWSAMPCPLDPNAVPESKRPNERMDGFATASVHHTRDRVAKITHSPGGQRRKAGPQGKILAEDARRSRKEVRSSIFICERDGRATARRGPGRTGPHYGPGRTTDRTSRASMRRSFPSLGLTCLLLPGRRRPPSFRRSRRV